MLCRIFRFFAVVFIIFTPVLVRANDIPAITITDKTNPKIVELYQKLQDKSAEIAGIESERLGALEENATAMYEKEQSLENKTLTATTTVATGLGAMEAARAIAEKIADADAEEKMSEYITTMKCEYGNGKQVDLGNEETLPGGNELANYYAEYKQLAEKLKTTKKALNLRPGIESQILYDRAESGVYQYQNAGQQSGAYTSLSRALMNPEGKDAATWNAQKQESSENLKAGLVAAGGGIVASVIGNYEINKDAPKESSAEINREYDDKVSKINKEKTDIETELTNAIEENRQRVQEYNQMVERLRNSRNAIEQAPADCRELFGDYIGAVDNLELIENETDVVPDVAIPEMDSDLLAQCVQCKNKGADFKAETKECKCPADKPVEKGGQCVEKPTEVIPAVEDEIPVSESQEIEKETPKADYCPKTGNALKAINDTHKVGDNCTSDIISQGTITKRQNGTCTCNATGCWTPYTPKGGKCVKVEGTSTDAGGSDKTGDAYIDENGFCKPYKIKEWFFNKESSADISKKFQKLCDEAAKAHNCERKDLNTSRLIEKDDSGAVQYEWTCNADSEDYLATQERINQRHANLSYENVCKKLKPGTTNQEGQIKRGCFGIFEDIDIPDYKTQLELAKARIGTSSACSEKREVRRSTASNNPVGYYTNCNTTNDKERYTFIFTGVGNDNTTPENLMRAACATYGVKFGAQGGELGRKQPYCSYTYKSVDNDPTCNKIDTLAQKFGYTARIVRGTGCVLDTTGGVGGDKLAQSGMRSDEKIRDLKTAFGIDNTLFANISTNMDEWLYDQMKNIVSNEMKRAGHSDPLVSFECFPTKSFALDKGIEAKLHLVDGGSAGGRNVLTCRANGRDIDFVFQKLGHVTKRRANASKEGLTCIFGSNGKYDGRQCWGITEEDCTKLNNTIKEHAKNCSQCGAQWLPKAGDEEGFCSLTKSTKVEKTNKGLEIAGNVALIAGGAVLTVMSGGMAMPMLVTELALMGVELTGATVAAVEEKRMRNVAEEFLRKTQYCHDAICAQKLLTDSEVHRILNLESNLDDKISNTIDEKMAELLQLVPNDAPLYVALLAGIEDKPNCNFWHNVTRQCEWEQFWHAWANVAQFASLGVALGRSAIRFIHARTAITKVATQSAKKMTRAQAKRIRKIDARIAELEKTTNRTADEATELTKLRQERNTILNKVGTKDADEVAKLSADAYNPKIEEAQSEYQKLLKEREALAKRMGTNRSPGKVELQDIDRRIANQEKKLKDLGANVEPVEPLWKGGNNTVASKPKPQTASTPAETGAGNAAANSNVKPQKQPVTIGNEKPASVSTPETSQSQVRAKLGDKTNASIEDIKLGKQKQLQIPTSRLTDDEWKVLKEDLSKEGLEVSEVPGNAWHYVKKTEKVDAVKPVPKATSTSTPKSMTAKMTVSELAKKDTKTIIDEAKNLSPTQRSELYSTLTPAQRNSIAKMKVDSKTVTLPFGSNIDDLAKNPELLDITGDYLPLNQKALAKAAEPDMQRFTVLRNKLAHQQELERTQRELIAAQRKGTLSAEEVKRLESVNKELSDGAKLTKDEVAEYNKLMNDLDPIQTEIRHITSSDISVDAIIANGTQYKEKLLNIISSDPSLRRQAQNFDKLSKTQKENFMNQVVKKLDVSFGVDTKTRIKYVDSWVEIGGDAEMDARALGFADSDKKIIYMLNDSPVDLGYGNKLDNTMAVVAHEHGHIMDGAYAEKVAVGGNQFGHKFGVSNTDTWEDYAEYLMGATERSSRGINEVVGTNFTKDLNATIKSGKVTTSPISDIEKIKIQSGLTGNTFVPSSKQTNGLGVDLYKFTPPVERPGSLQQMVDNMKELGVEHVAVIKEDGKEVVAIFDNADDYNAAMRKVNTPASTPKSAPKTSASASRGTDSIDALKTRASSNFDNYLQSCVSGGACNGLPVDRLTKEEWQQLNQYAKSRGAELFETKMFNKKTGTYDDIMRFRRLNSTNDVVASTNNVANKLTPAQEEAEWRALYEKYAPGNQTFDNFKKSFGNNLDEAEEYAKNWGATESLDFGKTEKTADKLWTDFNNKYGTKGDKYPYSKYADIRAQGISADEYLDIKQKGMSTDEYWASKLGWSKEQIEDANKVYMAQQDVKIARNAKTPAGKGDVYSTFDSDIAALRKELQSNLSSSVYDKINPFFHKGTLTLDEYNNLVEYVSHKTYDSQMLVNAFNKEPGLKDIASEAYDNFLAIKSENIRKIDEAAGLHGGVNRATRELIPKNEFVQNFVSDRVTLYEDIITQNPNIYSRAKKWNMLTTKEKEKLCKEIFEIADNKLGVQHVEFGVKDLVKEFGTKTTTEGYQINGKVYLSSRHLPNMSFQDAMSVLAHEQAHKVDALSPNKGILGSQLADLGSKEGYIQSFIGYAQGDYRKELTEQSAWMIQDAMKKAISKLGL